MSRVSAKEQDMTTRPADVHIFPDKTDPVQKQVAELEKSKAQGAVRVHEDRRGNRRAPEQTSSRGQIMTNFYRALRRAYNAFKAEWNRARYQQRKRREQLQQEGF
jgi:leucyl aminopeptidase (aminopeptidase T)